jgi:glutamate-ammonia-ligase adenylyltransferase
MSSPRLSSLAAQLARLGFTDSARAERLLDDPVLAWLAADLPADAGDSPPPTAPDDGDGAAADGALLALLEGRSAGEDVLAAIGDGADPDLALLNLVRMLESLERTEIPPGGLAAVPRLHDELRRNQPFRERLFAVLGTSAALGDHLARHPRHWVVLLERGDDVVDPGVLRAELLTAVGADPDAAEPAATLPREAAHDALRVAYRRRLLAIAARDLAAADPMGTMPSVARALADLAAAALEAGLAIARSDLPDGAAPCRITVLGMGKCGGRELNYVSDVDVIFVVEPPEAGEEAERGALATGTRLATGMARACSVVTGEGTLWPVDAALRPEGKQGPLVRTLASHVSYYERWAATWEFQALLKARVVAGDRALGEAYLEAIRPMVWRAAERENFVEDVQAMRRRVEEHVPARDGDRQLKLGPGGLRDVEFSVQLLQLVHGRWDERLRTSNTLEALEALGTYGYVGRDDAAELDRAYRMLRALEHRLQLHRMTRTHVVPESPDALRRLGRSFGFRANAGKELTQLWRRHALEVRRLHEKLFYRPLLAAAARLTTDEARLTPEAAVTRLAALGYRDPGGAMRHLVALTAGVSRRAAIQRQLLAVMLGWFADGADPDAGLLAFRRLSDALGSTHWYLRMLRDSGAAAERLAVVLSSSRLVADLLQKGPEAVALLEDDEALAPRTLAAIVDTTTLARARYDDPVAAALAVRAVRRREILRTAVADIVGLADVGTVGRRLSDAAIAALRGGLAVASDAVAPRFGGELPTRLLVVAMGRLGGYESGYGSDADVLFVHDPLPGAEEQAAHQAAMAVFAELRRLMVVPGPEPALAIDADLRPEGRQGPLVRSYESFVEYYERWSSPWEAQALTRALPAAGDDDLGARFVALVDPLRWPEGGIDDHTVREIRRIKARVEAERLPRGADPHRHVKLGRGGLADVEWTVQLLQLRHAHEVPAMRTTGTLAALAAAADAGIVTEADAAVLAEAWELAAQLRNATMLWSGRANDSLPSRFRDLDGVARLAGYPPASAGRLDEDYLRTTRRARSVVERVFYG